ncbi:FAD-dependent 5-carboxymethylaminomethyl-2-thiouridine(34) oxidoreductase MnmC [Nitrincola sp. MINF-07-Sa-05]|uniref:FAD-dependent 5-carboxymethylaminomethyl-2-thiouridine(34) oxidoreductase MnmC n=1 Tax=Nitrincola salilacus TaxID=3400273 RepID=UPI0039186182
MKQPIWFSRQPTERPEAVIIVGAGLAGATTARALAERGIRVKVLERQNKPAQAGSGNPQGALYAKLSARPTAHSDFHLAGFQQVTRLLAPLMHTHPDMVSLCGVLQLALTDKEAKRQQELIELAHYSAELVQWVDQTTATAIAGSEVGAGGLFFPSAGWVSPPAFCHWLLEHPQIELITGCEVKRINRTQDGWMLDTANRTQYSASVVVVCGAAEAAAFEPLHHLPLKPIRGQTSYVEASPGLPHIKTVVCGDGYISPALHGRYCFGASFNLHNHDAKLTIQDQQENLEKLVAALPGFAALNTASIKEGRVGFRCTTPDYLPAVGPAPVFDSFIEHYGKLRDDANWRFSTPASFHDGLYINAGHGSKGLITCPISAELLAAQICDEPLPLENAMSDLVHPARFIIKKLIRNQL